MTSAPFGIRLPRVPDQLESGFWNAAVPSLCVVPLQQHTGSRIEPLVDVGDFVREGMVIAESARRLSVPLHAPIPGRIREIGTTRLFDGTMSPALSIELDGEFDRLGKRVEPFQWDALDRDALLQRIRAAGVLCAPRSSVPAHLFLGTRRRFGPRFLVLDLAETEPYMTGGLEQAVADPEGIIVGLQITAHIIEADHVMVIIGRGNRRRLALIRRRARELGYRIRTSPRRYPSIPDRAIRSILPNVSAAGVPGDDLFVIAPSTVHAIFEAVVYEKPQIDHVIAVGGSAVGRPAHVRVRIGTAIADILAECGGLTEEPVRIVAGGPITGREITNINAPVTKSVAAVVAMTEHEVRAAEQEPCIACGACTRACPVNIDPQYLLRHIEEGREDDAIRSGLHECIECGLCSHVCPSRIPLAGTFRAAKERTSTMAEGAVRRGRG
ncbi:MAG: RnfABCDGE type electron transport complex subunit C [Alkalispirochaeta sp.]